MPQTTTIKISIKTAARLKKAKRHPRESMDEVIIMLLDLWNDNKVK